MVEVRNITVDIAKGIGIALVVFGHNWMIQSSKGEIFRIIFSFHMPLFFFLTGMFFRPTDGFRAFFLSRINLLLKPYFLILISFGLLKLTGDILKRNVIVESKYFDYFSGVFYGTGSTIEWIPMWFLPHLFIASIFAFAIAKFCKKNIIQKVLVVILLAVGVAAMQPSQDLPWSIDLLPVTISFVLLGYVCRNIINSIGNSNIYISISVLVFFSLHLFFNETMDLNIRHYGNPYVVTLQALSGIYLCLWVSHRLSKCLPLSKILSYIGSGTLFILIFHTYFEGKEFNIIKDNGGDVRLAIFFSFIAGVTFPLVLWECVKKSKYLSYIVLYSKKK